MTVESLMSEVTVSNHSPEHLFGTLLTFYFILDYESSLVAQMVKHLPTMQETWVRSLGWEDLLEKEMANA